MTITHDSDQISKVVKTDKEPGVQNSNNDSSMDNVISARQASILAKDSCVVRTEKLISDTFQRIRWAAEQGECSIDVTGRSYDLRKLQDRLEALDYNCTFCKRPVKLDNSEITYLSISSEIIYLSISW